MDEELYEIKKIGYGLLSDDEIRDMSVCEVYNSKLSVANADEMVISHEDGVHFFDNSASKLKCNTVYDEAMGNINPEKKCQTCGLIGNKCPGHFGHIELPYPKVHTLFKKDVCNFLNIICFNCNRLLFTKDVIYLKKINLFTGYNRYLKIVAEAKKSKYCYNCETYHNTIKFAADKDIFYIDYKTNKDCDAQTKSAFKAGKDQKGDNADEESISQGPKVQFSTVKKSKKNEQELDTLYIKKIFDNILDEDITLLGLNVKNMHPKHMIKSVIPVIPISARPPVYADDNICDDDTTTQYIEIVKLKNILENEKISEFDKLENINKLKYRIDTLFCNSKDKAKHTSNSNPVKSISSRLGGKSGLIRCNIMGKRCNQTGRTVAGPDTSLKSDEIGVPMKMANILTYPVRVAEFNKSILEKLVNDNRAKRIIKNAALNTKDGIKDPNAKRRIINVDYALNVKGTLLKYNDVVIRPRSDSKLGDTWEDRSEEDGENTEEIIIKNPHNFKLIEGDRIIRNGEEINDVKYPKKRYIKLELGDIVERYLMNGDIIFINRQPTLWKGSMIAMKTFISKKKSLTVNLSVCRSMNLDNDGDELNIHIPQTVQEEAELRVLSTATQLIMNGQSGTNNINVIQDSLLSAFLINKWNENIPKADFYNLCMACQDWSSNYILKKIKHIRNVLTEISHKRGDKIIPIKVFNGRGLFSMLLPDDFIYGNYKAILKEQSLVASRSSTAPIPLPTSVIIYKGVLLTGMIDKKIISSGRDTLIQILHKDYSPEVAINFINNTQFMMNKWMSTIGFSIGLEDCIPQNYEEIKNTVNKLLFKSENIASSILNPAIKEVKINASLNETRDAGLRIAKNSLRKDNNFISTVDSGSKGDYFNIAQITGLLGQQNIEGKRMSNFINHGKRSMPYFDFDEENLSIKEKYMSRGFVKNSFIKGLNPVEFYNHAMGGRNNVMDTALKTAETGYLQRRMGKIMEGVMVRYDQTVRDSNNSIIQFVYSGNGFDRTQTSWVETKDGGMKIAPVNIKRICDRLNNED